MRIAHLISSSGLFGAENVLLNLARYSNERNIFAAVGAVRNNQNPHLEIIEEAKKGHIPFFVIESRGRFDFKAVAQLKDFLIKNNIDILHTHNYKSNVIGLLAAKKVGIPIVATAHGFTGVSKAVSFYEGLDRFILKQFFNRVVVVSDKVLANGHNGKRKVIPNGLDFNRFRPDKIKGLELRKKFGLQADQVVIGTIGRLSKEKNQKLLIDSFNALVKNDKRLRLLIVGDGPQKESLKQTVSAYHLEKYVIFTGIIDDVASVYQALDIFVLSSTTEGVPLTILEAMASQVPVVATRVGGIPEIIEDQKAGLLAVSQDINDLAGKIKMIVDNPPLAARIKQEALRVVQNKYSVERMGEEYRRVYEEVYTKRK